MAPFFTATDIGLWLFMRELGRIGRPGQTREIAFPTIDEAHRALERQRRAKERRGYARVDAAVTL
jgi:predicted DNA-binding WGR domain protein